MSETKVASRYAKSLIDLAKEQNNLEEVNNDITFFLEVCHYASHLLLQSFDLVLLRRLLLRPLFLPGRPLRLQASLELKLGSAGERRS